MSATAIHIEVNDDLSLSVFGHSGDLLWESSRSIFPTATVRTADGALIALPLSSARDREVSDYRQECRVGQRIRLGDFAGTDVVLELAFAVETASDELSVQVRQVGGRDAVVGIEHLYRFEKPVADGGHLILPHGSGYLIPAESPDELPGKRDRWCDNNRIGDRWTLPLFGVFRGGCGMCIIVDTWWDCEVLEEHVPGKHSALDFNWIGSLGSLAYSRRFTIRFGEGMDYVEMAKSYRELAREQGLVRTLAEKAEQTPAIHRYIENILLRWPAWNGEERHRVLNDIAGLRGSGLGVSFFFPKWSSRGCATQEASPDSGWQSYLLDEPVPGGWRVLGETADAARELGCPIQMMLTMPWHFPDAPGYDATRWALDSDGSIAGDTSIHYGLGTCDAPERLRLVIDSLQARELMPDVLYFDGYSAFPGIPEDFSPAHPMTRRANFEAQNECFAETRRRGMMPSGELARFWCMADCDYFFYTDWSADRLVNGGNRTSIGPVGEPIPLFELVFHDCYTAGFSGGGYALYSAGVDWWEDRTPRLYELLFASAPAYNWLPEGSVPIEDWGSSKMQRRLAWLKRWSAYYRAIAVSEMVSHRFVSSDRSMQRIEYANGVVAEFDMAGNRFRVTGVPGFSGNWESPGDLQADSGEREAVDVD